MKRFHVFVFPYTQEGLMASAIEYYKGSFDNIGIAQINTPLIPRGYCQILNTSQDGSLQLVKSAYEENGQWTWMPLSVLD